MNHNPSSPPFIPAAEALPAIIEALPASERECARFEFTRQRQAQFLKRLADCGEVRAAAKSCAISHQTVYRTRRSCPLFRQGWDAALLVAREQAEDALATRAINGVEEEVFYHGEVVATRRRYDSRLLLAHLARLDRLAGREDVAALALRFDDLIEAFEGVEGSPSDGASDSGGDAALEDWWLANAGGENTEHDLRQGACNMRSTGEEGEAANAPFADLEARLSAMEAARPDDAVPLNKLASGIEGIGTLEAAQLAAFEAGIDRWWELELAAGFEPEGSGGDELHADLGVTGSDHADLLGSGAAEIDAAPGDEGAAIVDPHSDAAPGGGVGDAHDAAKGQGAVRGGERAHVETLAIGGEAAVEALAIVGSDPEAEVFKDAAFERRLDQREIDRAIGDEQSDMLERGAERGNDVAELPSEGIVADDGARLDGDRIARGGAGKGIGLAAGGLESGDLASSDRGDRGLISGRDLGGQDRRGQSGKSDKRGTREG